MTFKTELMTKLKDSMSNEYGIENYDQNRFGTYHEPAYSIVYKVKEFVTRILGMQRNFKHPVLDNYLDQLDFLHKNLHEHTDRELLIELLAQRVLGFRKVMLRTNNSEYRSALKKIEDLQDWKNTIDSGFRDWKLPITDLSSVGYDIKLFFTAGGIATDFLLEQYAYKLNGKTMVGVEEGDTVLDIGGCWGDTALYFGCKAKKTGHVYSFEFIPNNKLLHQKNIQMNPSVSDRITLVGNAVWSVSDKEIYFEDMGPGSSVSFENWPEADGVGKTISIDDFVSENKIDKVDFIKMDIEGAEPKALEGAIKTIKQFKPKLAIAIYHSLDDFVNIPKWILDLDIGYELNLGHYTIYKEETIIFAKVK